MAEEAKKFGLGRWQRISTIAGVTGALGIFLILNFSKPELMRILVSLALMSEGIMNRCIIKYTVKDPGKSPANHISKHSKETEEEINEL